jgi:hypothetical protein
MRYLKTYKIRIGNLSESKNTSKSFDEKDLEIMFAHTFDLCSQHSIDIIYFDPISDEWANNDWSNPNSPYHPDECIVGYCLNIHHGFYNETDAETFDKFIEIITELKSDMDRFKSIYNPSYIGYINSHSDIIEIAIKP